MSGFTAEDFEQAMFAVHPDPDAVDARYAARMNRDPEYPWLLDGVPGNGDEHMAADGWVPVVESRVTEGTLRHVEERAERKRQKLIAHIESVEAAVRDRNRTIEELRAARKEDGRREHGVHVRNVYVHRYAWERKDLDDLRRENRRLDAEADGAISLDGLEVAWEAAEVPTEDTPIREGDVVIEKISASAYAVMSPPPTCGLVGREFRVLSRAPREPWQDLADSLEAEVQWIDRFNAVDAAQALHAAGWRKGGGES